MDDSQAIHRFVDRRDADAFRILVERHLSLVYSAALRQVTDPGLAQDVTQAVFILLSQKAHQLHASPNLAGWLLKATHFVCRDARKRSARRQFHEAEAAAMRQRQTPETPDASWEAIRPHLDDALTRLSTPARTAVALRFLENRPLKEVGAALGVSEEAARKRVDRALAQLRRMLLPHGGTAALGAVLAARAMESVPPAVTAAVFGPATPIAATLAAAGWRLGLALKLKLVAAAATVIILAGIAGVMLAGGGGNTNPSPTAAPARTTATSAVAGTEIYKGILLDPTGKPAPNAAIRVYLVDELEQQRLEWQGQTAADGTFVVGPLKERELHDGYTDHYFLLFDAPSFAFTWWQAGENSLFEDPANLRITLARPTEVAGTITNSRGQPVADAVVEPVLYIKDGSAFQLNAKTGLTAKTDAQGRYLLTRIPEGFSLLPIVRHSQYCTWPAQGRRAAERFPVKAGTPDADIELADNPATIRAQLTRRGQPLAQEGIEIFATDNRVEDVQVAITDAAGRVEFHGLNAGAWAVGTPMLSSGPMVLPARNFQLAAGETRDLKLELGDITVRGKVVDATTGTPGRTIVSARTLQPQNTVAEVRPDEHGQFTMILPPGRYQFTSYFQEAGKSQQASQEAQITAQAPIPEILLKVNTTPSLQGTLVDADGRPLAGLVTLEGRTELAKAGPDGRFAFWEARLLFPDLNLIGVAVDASRTRACGFSVNPRDMADNPDLRLVLQPLAALTGKAVDRAGKPLPDTRVEIYLSLGNSMSVSGESFSADFGKVQIRNDASFRIDLLPAGFPMGLSLKNRDEFTALDLSLDPGETRNLGQLVLHGPISAANRFQQFQPDPTLVIDRPLWDRSLKGRILDPAGKPVISMTLFVTTVNDRGIDYTFETDLITDLKGRFEITGLPRDRLIKIKGTANGQFAWQITPQQANPLELRANPTNEKKD